MSETSVFELINTLCEKLINENARKPGKTASFRTLRANAFQIILQSSGSCGILEDPLRELDFHLFEMKTKASTVFHREHYNQMGEILEGIEGNPFFRSESGKSILTFLFHMKNHHLPDVYRHFQETYPFGLFSSLQSARETNPYITVTEEMFQLPDALPSLNIRGENPSNPYFEAFSENLGKNIFTQNLLLAREMFSKDFQEILMTKQLANEGNSQERNDFDSLCSLQMKNPLELSQIECPKAPAERKITPLESFMYDLRALCCGFKSPSFVYRRKYEEFRLKKNIRVENVTVNTLKQYVRPFLEFGTCMRRLQQLVASGDYQSQLDHGGFTFRAFCMEVSQYLAHVRHFIVLTEGTTMLEFSYKLSSIVDQVTTLGRLCQLNPAAPAGSFPLGGRLLQYVSTQLSLAMRPEIFLLLANIMIKCVEFYFSHLEMWIHQGVLEDRYHELFIVYTDQYSYDSKKFFDKAYSVQENLIPDFLTGLTEDIILCGKYTMLLKAYKPFHPLLDIPKPSLNICLSGKLIDTLRASIAAYAQRATAACGPKVTIEEINRRKQVKMENLKRLVEKTMLENLQKWEIERKEADAATLERKKKQLKELQLQIESAKQEKAEKRRKEIAEELLFLEQRNAMEENEMQRKIEESERRIQHYRELNDLAEKKLERIGKGTEGIVNENYMRGMKKSASDIINANEIIELDAVAAPNEAEENVECLENNYKNCDNSKLNVNLPERSQMTPCQRNKLKVMSHEYNISIPMDSHLSRAIREETMTELERNRQRILHRDFNSNTDDDGGGKRNRMTLNLVESERVRNRKKVLETEFDIAIPTKEKLLTPMSTTSDYSVEASEKVVSPDLGGEDEDLIAVEEVEVEDEFEQEEEKGKIEEIYVEEVRIEVPQKKEQKIRNFFEEIETFKTPTFTHKPNTSNYSMSDLASLNGVSMKEFLRLSIAIPLECHMSLLNREIMKMFLEDLDILGHWQSLRNYFFLIDGEFGSHICDGLFECLERGTRPDEFLNFYTLHTILDTAMSYSAASRDANSKRLSFIVDTIPEKFDLLSPNVLESLRLSYAVEWPVNLILSSNTLHQYAIVFQYLLKVRHVGWILENLFQHLKEICRADANIAKSQHYHHIHMMRHKFSHFILTLQNHITVTALETSWRQFMRDLQSAQSMMDLYRKHTTYIKRIKFLCMLNRQSEKFLSAIEDVFKIIIRFSRIVMAKSFTMSSKGSIHPRYEKLRRIEGDFDKLMRHIVQMGWKIVANGYQTEIGEFISHLNWGEYYSQVELK
ncbi:uncharacterized protein LOC129796032 [Lutzomyia longipalpis]|uniref:uncharacterized protein LOC129796032 n=1 Tax=Lutzomyia longipalpis TaxID=7200 RepID=UPI0024843A98|nr:uncharacterized protein LOC129796032 [Lutzomyia longipalpis]